MIQISTAPLPCASFCLAKLHGRLQASLAVWAGRAVGQRKGDVTDLNDPSRPDVRGRSASLALRAQRANPDQTTGDVPGTARMQGRNDCALWLVDLVGTRSADHRTQTHQSRGPIYYGQFRVQAQPSRNDRAATSCVNYPYSPYGRWLPALRRSKFR